MSRINGKYLKEKRTERGCSLRAFADKIYTSKSTASRWEQTFLPENETVLNAVAEFFGMTVDEMRKESEQKYPSREVCPPPKANRAAEPTKTGERKEGNAVKTLFLSVGIVASFVILLFGLVLFDSLA